MSWCLLWHNGWNEVKKEIIRSVAQSGSAPGLGPGGPRFESLYSDQRAADKLHYPV